MSEEKRDKYDIELPQSIIESFARFLVPEMKRYYTEQNEKTLQNSSNASEIENNRKERL